MDQQNQTDSSPQSSGQTENQTQAESSGGQPKILGKYENLDAFVSAHKELQRSRDELATKLKSFESAPKPEGKSEGAPTADMPDHSRLIPDIIDMLSKGNLGPQELDRLSKLGAGDRELEMLRSFAEGQSAQLREQAQQYVKTPVDELLSWANNYYDDATLHAYQALLNSRNFSALASIEADFLKAKGTPGLKGQLSSGSQGGYSTPDEITKAMRHPGWANEPGYQEQVRQKLEATDPQVYETWRKLKQGFRL